MQHSKFLLGIGSIVSKSADTNNDNNNTKKWANSVDTNTSVHPYYASPSLY